MHTIIRTQVASTDTESVKTLTCRTSTQLKEKPSNYLGGGVRLNYEISLFYGTFHFNKL